MERRELLAMGAALWMQDTQAKPALPEPETLTLWASGLPAGGGGPSGPEQVSAKGSVTQISTPRLVLYRPTRPDGSAALLMAGGGYAHIERRSESIPTAEWLSARGTTVYELIYRLPGEGWPREAPFQDAQRAIRLILSRAAQDGVNAQQVGVIGFSAGGHLAAMTAARSQDAWYAASDSIDQIAVRAHFAALLYPVITFMPPYDQTHARREIVGRSPSRADSEKFSVEQQIDASMAPTFLAQAADDATVPVQNSLLLFNALKAAKVQVEMHIFQQGGHGWGMGRDRPYVDQWPGLFERWARNNGWFQKG